MTTAPTRPETAASDRLPPERVTQALRDMLLIREFELRTMAAYQQAKIGGFCHIYIGQEAVAVGTVAAVEHHDPIILAYRDHGHALARGMDPKACMAEMYGKAAGCAKGKGGSMHMFDRPNNLFGGHGIVGAQTPLGAGLAFAHKYELDVLKRSVDGGDAKKKVTLCFLGDGALNQGALHEAMNLAGLYSLPVIYCLENNGYSMGTSIERGTTQADALHTKAEAYGIRYAEFDGMSFHNLYDGMKPLVDECREQQKPAFVNIKCYRYQGHSMSDPQKYRTKDEVQTYQEQDPINQLADIVVQGRDASRWDRENLALLSEDDYKAMQKDIKAIVREAVQFAEEADVPALEELFTDVYQNLMPNLSPTATYRHGAPNPLLGE